jgi:hypothetical protein
VTLWIVLSAIAVVLVVAVFSLRKYWHIVLPVTASIVIGLLIGATAVLGATIPIGNQSPQPQSDKGAALLNRVEYGDRH